MNYEKAIRIYNETMETIKNMKSSPTQGKRATDRKKWILMSVAMFQYQCDIGLIKKTSRPTKRMKKLRRDCQLNPRYLISKLNLFPKKKKKKIQSHIGREEANPIPVHLEGQIESCTTQRLAAVGISGQDNYDQEKPWWILTDSEPEEMAN